VIVTGLAGQDPALASAVEAQVLGRAPAQTAGQVRAALNRAVLASGPSAAERRRQAEEKCARIGHRPEPGGVTATLTGRYLPVAPSFAAWNRIDAIARQMKESAADASLGELRAHAYLALLSCQPLPSQDMNSGAADGTRRPCWGTSSSFATSTARPLAAACPLPGAKKTILSHSAVADEHVNAILRLCAHITQRGLFKVMIVFGSDEHRCCPELDRVVGVDLVNDPQS